MKPSEIRPAIRQTAFAAAVGVNLLIAPKVSAQAIASRRNIATSGAGDNGRHGRSGTCHCHWLEHSYS